jgi:hypothetical protein
LRGILAKDPASAIRANVVQSYKIFIINLSCDAAMSKIAVRDFPSLKTGVITGSTPHSQPV